MGTLKDLMKKKCKLKGELVLCTCCSPDGTAYFFVVGNIKGGKIINR